MVPTYAEQKTTKTAAETAAKTTSLDYYFDKSIPTIKEILNTLNDCNVILKSTIYEKRLGNEKALETLHAFLEHHKAEDCVVIVPTYDTKQWVRTVLKGSVEVETINNFLYERLNAGYENSVNEQQEALIAYNLLPEMSAETKIKLAQDMTNALNKLMDLGIAPEEISRDEEPLLKEIGNIIQNTYLINSYSKKLELKDVYELAKIFVSFARQYSEYKKSNHYFDFFDLVKRFDGKIKEKYVFALNVSDMTPLQQEIIAKIEPNARCLITASENTLMAFRGADAKTGPLVKGSDKISYYVKNAMLGVTSGTGQRREYEIVANGEERIRFDNGNVEEVVVTDKQDFNKVAVEYALQEAQKGKRVSIMVESNSAIEQIAALLEYAKADYTAIIKYSADEQILQEARDFVLGLLSTDKGKIINAMETHFSPVPLNVVLSNKEAFIKGNNVEFEPFKPFLDLQKEVHTLDDIIKILERHIETLERHIETFRNLKDSSTVYAVVNSLRAYERNVKNINYEELGALILLTTTYNSYKKPGTERTKIFVSTPFSEFVSTAKENFDTVIYVGTKSHKGLKNAVDVITEAIASLHDKQRSVDEAEELENKIRTALSNAGEKFVFVGNARRVAGTVVTTVREPEHEWPIELPQLRLEVAEAAIEYLKQIDSVSFSLLNALDNLNSFIKNYVLGYRITDELIDIGTDVHMLLERMFNGDLEKGRNPKIDELIDKYYKPIENAKQIISELKQEGYEQTSAEEHVKTPFIEIDEQLNTEIKDWNPLVVGDIDAVFKGKDGAILIVDFKTGESNNDTRYNYDEQLALYRLLYAKTHAVPLEKIKVAVAHIGLRGPFEGIASAGYALNMISPDELKNAENKLKKHFLRIYELHKNPDTVVQLLGNNIDSTLKELKR
ncbi:MAG: PD-(D/E)XK nuclease family protein [Candidatus Micrarchaeaceae archaeon]